MRNCEIEQEMYRRAAELIETRYPTGWGGAGIVHTSKGNYYTSVSHCLCLVREDENSPYQVLSPCGICQERLRFWGEDVQVAVTTGSEEIKFVELKELQPYHWTKAYPAEELDHWNG